MTPAPLLFATCALFAFYQYNAKSDKTIAFCHPVFGSLQNLQMIELSNFLMIVKGTI